MSTIRVATNFNIDLEFKAAPFHRRLIAWVLDVLVLLIYLYAASSLMNSVWRSPGRRAESWESMWALVLLLAIPLFTYHLICEALMNGQSIGKRLMGLRVVNENGGKPSISQYIIRWLIRTSDYMAVVIIIYAPAAVSDPSFFWKIGATFGLLVADVILVNATAKQQRLGDILAHTLLIRTAQKATIEETIFLAVGHDYTPQFPQIMRLTDRDMNALKGILDTAKKGNDYNLAERAAEKLKSHLSIDSSLSPFDFLETLLKDYNYLSAN